MCKLIYGVGINDSDYPIRRSKHIDGKLVYSWVCPYYQTWLNMLSRCYGTNKNVYTPSYSGVSVCEEWLKFSEFKSWMEKQEWEGKELDKDLFGDGLLYKSENCCFISKQMNLLVSSFRHSSGVSRYKDGKRWRAYYYDPVSKKQVGLGLYESFEDAAKISQSTRVDVYKKKVLDNINDPDWVKERFLKKMLKTND